MFECICAFKILSSQCNLYVHAILILNGNNNYNYNNKNKIHTQDEEKTTKQKKEATKMQYTGLS